MADNKLLNTMELAQKVEEDKKKRAALLEGLTGEERRELESSRQREESITDYGELADMFAKGLTKYAAGRKGAKEGIDLSGIEGEGVDWDKIRKRASDKYKSKLADIAGREERALELVKSLEKDKKKEGKRFPVSGVVEKESGLPVYRIEGKPGYYDAEDRPIAKEAVESKEKQIPDMYRTTIIEDKSQLTESGLPVYKKIITNKANPQDVRIELMDIHGAPLKEGVRPKTGLDPRSVLSDKEATALASAEAAMEMLDVIKSDKGKIDTGPISSFQNWVAQKVGVDDPSVTGFKANVQDTLNRYIKEMTGAQMSETEAERLMAAMPKMSDQDASFLKKLELTKDRIKLYNERYKNGLRKRGKDLGEDFPRKVRKGSKEATVSNKQEYQEALNEGWK